jgi:hypothetical protein
MLNLAKEILFLDILTRYLYKEVAFLTDTHCLMKSKGKTLFSKEKSVKAYIVSTVWCTTMWLLIMLLLLLGVNAQKTCSCKTVPNSAFTACQIFNYGSYCMEGFGDASYIDAHFKPVWMDTDMSFPQNYDERVATGIIRASSMCKSLSYNFDCSIAAIE